MLLTSGDRAIAPGPSYGQGEGRSNGTNVRGAHDVSVLAVDLVIPAPATCLRFDVVFMSDEYPEFVGSSYNDAFLAEIDETTWSVSGSTITAPNNFAFDPNGKELSINSTFFQSARVIEPAESGVAYDGSTERLVVQTPITPGPHTLFLTIFDASDSILDTAALVDNLRAVVAGDEGCAAGANQPPTATDATVTTAEDTPVSFEVTADDADGDELTVLGLSDPAIGSVAADGAVSCIDGACTIPLRYVPDANAHGTDTFTVTVSDGNGGTATATVTVTVTPVADVPIAADVDVTTNEDAAVDIPLIGSDADGDALSFAVTGGPAHGAVVCVGAVVHVHAGGQLRTASTRSPTRSPTPAASPTRRR